MVRGNDDARTAADGADMILPEWSFVVASAVAVITAFWVTHESTNLFVGRCKHVRLARIMVLPIRFGDDPITRSQERFLPVNGDNIKVEFWTESLSLRENPLLQGIVRTVPLIGFDHHWLFAVLCHHLSLCRLTTHTHIADIDVHRRRRRCAAVADGYTFDSWLILLQPLLARLPQTQQTAVALTESRNILDSDRRPEHTKTWRDRLGKCKPFE